MTDEYDPTDDYWASYVEWCARQTNAAADEILARIDEAPIVDVSDDDVILIGLDGQIDGVWRVPGSPPDHLRVAIRRRPSLSLDVAPSASIPVAEYQRVGLRLYQRR